MVMGLWLTVKGIGFRVKDLRFWI